MAEIDLSLYITLPNPINVEHWTTYNAAQQQYADQCRAQKQPIDIFVQRYSGALALIRAGFVHINGLDQLQALLNQTDQKTTPNSVMGAIIRHVAFPVENSLDAPLPDWIVPSSST